MIEQENIPAAFETALADVLRGYDIGAETIIRCWHVIRDDYKWQERPDRTMPCVDLRCAAPAMDEHQRTLSCAVNIGIMTHGVDDNDHALISAMETAAQAAVFALFAGFANQATSGAWHDFKTSIAEDCPSVTIGGLTLGDPNPPGNDGETNSVGLTLTVHFCSTKIV